MKKEEEKRRRAGSCRGWMGIGMLPNSSVIFKRVYRLIHGPTWANMGPVKWWLARMIGAENKYVKNIGERVIQV